VHEASRVDGRQVVKIETPKMGDPGGVCAPGQPRMARNVRRT